MLPCPKCGYERKPADTAPDWQCPGCGIAIAKYVTALHVPANTQAAKIDPGHSPAIPHARAEAPDEATEKEIEDANATPAEVKRAQWIELALTACVAAVAALGDFFMDRRSHTISLLALPWGLVALVAAFGNWFTYRVRDRHDGSMARSSVMGALIVSAVVLIGRAWGYGWPSDAGTLLGYGLAGGATMAALAIATSASLRWR